MNQDIYHRELAIGFRGLTNSYESGYDAIMYDMRPTDIALELNDHSSDFVIAGIEDYHDEIEIPLHVKVDQEREVIFKIDALENFTPNNVYLKDTYTNQFYDLSNPVSLDLPMGDYTNRFLVTFTNNSTANTIDEELNNQIVIKDVENNLTIISNNSVIKQVSVHSILGQLLAQQNGNETSIILENTFKQGQLLLVKTELENGVILLNKIIKN